MGAAAYVHGVSTRDTMEGSEALMGEGVSRSTVRRTTRRLDTAVEELRHAPIEGQQYYPYRDARHLPVGWGSRVSSLPQGKAARDAAGGPGGPNVGEAAWSAQASRAPCVRELSSPTCKRWHGHRSPEVLDPGPSCFSRGGVEPWIYSIRERLRTEL